MKPAVISSSKPGLMFNASHAPLMKGHASKNVIIVTKKFVNEGSITKFTKICHENLELYGILFRKTN